jgi:hypothetical protein
MVVSLPTHEPLIFNDANRYEAWHRATCYARGNLGLTRQQNLDHGVVSPFDEYYW